MIAEKILKEHPYLAEDDLGIVFDKDERRGEFLTVIIENSGIQKILDHYSIKYEIVDSELNPYNYVRKNIPSVGFAAKVHVKGRAYRNTSNRKMHHTLSTCHHLNSDFNYEGELAEVRAVSKLARKIAGLYGWTNGDIVSRDEHFSRIRKKNDAVKNISDRNKEASSVSEDIALSKKKKIKERIKNGEAKRGI